MALSHSGARSELCKGNQHVKMLWIFFLVFVYLSNVQWTRWATCKQWGGQNPKSTQRVQIPLGLRRLRTRSQKQVLPRDSS